MIAAAARPALLVLAGVNGAGKSSVAGAWLREQGLEYFNPDEATGALVAAGHAHEVANASAWAHGRGLLERAITSGLPHAFETTLGGNTIPALIRRACDTHAVTMWFVGLDTPERHLARVARRVKRGGHDIPEPSIRARWDGARRNLIALLAHLHELRLYDNSEEHARSIASVEPRLLLHVRRGRIVAPGARALNATPDWAKPIVEAARRLPGPRAVP